MDAEDTFPPGSLVLGRYRTEERIGAGGFATVYRAIRLADGAAVALKAMHRHRLGAIEVRRFDREANLVAKLRHKNIVRQLEHGRTDEGVPILVLELLRGVTLRDRLAREGALSLWRAGQVALQVLAALEAAHGLRIAHRDIKPSNIFLCAGRPDAYVRLLDFGIAKAVDGEQGATRLTQTGRLVGTPAFMAPEQVRGGDVGLACDLYALGLVLCESLTGRRVVAGTSALEALAFQASNRELELPETVADSPLGAIVARAVRKRPADRWPSATAMREAIEAVLARHHAAPENAPHSSEPAAAAVPSRPEPRVLVTLTSTLPLDSPGDDTKKT